MGYIATQKATRRDFAFRRPDRRETTKPFISYTKPVEVEPIPLEKNFSLVEKIISKRGGLRELRMAMRLTGIAVSQKTKGLISATTIYQIETGHIRHPRINTVDKLMTFYKISFDQMKVLLKNRNRP